MRAEQTVSEMVVEVLARQAEAISERTGRPFEDAFAEVLMTPAGRQLAELADGPHRHERAAEWQADLTADREAQRQWPAALLLRGWESTEGPTTGQEIEKRILLVEDNEEFREAFARMLELELAPELNVAFAQADSLAEAHTLLHEEGGLDAALIDIGLPDGDGLDLVRELEGEGGHMPALPTLVITADLDHSVAARAIEAGARGVLSKMVSVRETAETVQMLIGAGRSTG
ncbi:MAG TPA: response regulator transcription factor [Rubrobacter sp.]|nr:response regulator transcription factor [Rubrobacter sp.]